MVAVLASATPHTPHPTPHTPHPTPHLDARQVVLHGDKYKGILRYDVAVPRAIERHVIHLHDGHVVLALVHGMNQCLEFGQIL